jgi:hypothetical protein
VAKFFTRMSAVIVWYSSTSFSARVWLHVDVRNWIPNFTTEAAIFWHGLSVFKFTMRTTPTHQLRRRYSSSLILFDAIRFKNPILYAL